MSRCGRIATCAAVLALIGVGVPSSVAAQDAATRQRIESVRRGSLLPAARRLQPNRRTGAAPLGRSDVAARVERLLGRAADEAGHRPARATALVGVAERAAERHGVALDRGELHTLRHAAERFQRLGRTLTSGDPALGRLIPREGAWSHETVGVYARQYAAWQREYNGGRPHEVLAKHNRYASHTTGRVPYWDVDPSIGDVDVVGLTEGSPFVTEDGRVRIFSHYMNVREHERLRAELGEPAGTIEAAMTSSYRTLILYPEGKLPYMLKFSGHEVQDQRKRLKASQVLGSVERTLQLRRFGFLVPEPSGLVARGVTALYRPLPLPSDGQLHPGDRLITWQVLMSRAFRQSPEGQRLFSGHGGFEAWSIREAVPRFADLLYRSMFESFAHLELHSQNVDVLVSEDGRIREVFVKDLLDMMHDPLAELVSGVEPLAPLVTRDETWGDMGAADAQYDTARFYQTYFGQLHDGTDRTFHARVVNHLRTLIRERPATRDLVGSELFTPSGGVRHPRFGLGAGDTPFEALAAIRRAFIRVRLAQRFRPDPTARARFEQRGRPRQMVGITGQRGPHFEITPETVFGFVGTTPAAIAWRHGAIEEGFLIFE